MASESVSEKPTVLYLRRWYLLLLFSVFSMESCAVWNTWGPIAVSAKQVYGWSDTTITMFTMWGCLAFPICFLPSGWILSKSLRFASMLACTCMAVASTMRCIPVLLNYNGKAFTVICHISSFLNAMAGPIAMSAPLEISSAWFPPEERTKSTSIGQMFNALGVGFSFVLGSVFVNNDNTQDGTTIKSDDSQVEVRQVDNDELETRMEYLLYFHAIFSVLIFGLMLAYFPSKPPTPPSHSAATARLDFRTGLLKLMKFRDAWLTMLTYAMTQGLVQMWQSVMVINLDALGREDITETWSSTLGTVISFVGVAVSILFAAMIDCFKSRIRLVISALLAVSGAIFVVITLLFEDFVVVSDSTTFKVLCYVLLLTGLSLAFSAAPMLFEFTVEISYPIGEGTVGVWLTLWFNILSVAFFAIFQIPNIGTDWLNYVLPVSVLFPLPFFLMVPQNLNRLTVDQKQLA